MSITENAIAIIGLGCRFPGADNIDAYWDLLRSGKNAISYFSKAEVELSGVAPLILNDKNYVKARGILNNIETFDQREYAFLEAELANLNLQARIFLQLVSQALDDAGINPKNCPKETAIFSGSTAGALGGESGLDTSQIHNMQSIIEMAYARSLSSIVAYQFDLRGRAVSLHTGCSTSLVAVIQACDELLLKNADLAIAGAVSVAYPERVGYLYEEKGVLSPNGICRPFDEEANGTVLSNGAGVVVLKRYEDAVQAGDKIYSVITGRAMNNDGRMKTDFLAASIQGQHGCIKRAWHNANIGLNQIDYIEAHGSATKLGDPIEIFALKKTQDGQKYDEKWCGIGSVKSNIGHATVASGMASLIKAALMIHHKAIVPTLNFNVLNKHIDLDRTPFYIASEYKELPQSKKNFHIGVSNFGFGGTNTHLVLKNPNSSVLR